MPYPQDLVGKYVNYTVDPGGTMNAALAAGFVHGILPGQTTTVTAQVYATPAPAPPIMGGHRAAPPPPIMGGHRVSPTAVNVVNTNAPWNFTFLKYVGGAVTMASLATPVLTGPMSGCFLCSYTQGGQNLAHIGTANSPDSQETRDVKVAWMAFVARADVSSVSGGDPYDYFPTTEFQAATINGQPPLVCGYFDGTSAYAILFSPLPRNMNPPGLNLIKVAAVKKMTLQPWSAIAAMTKFSSERIPNPNPYDPSIIRFGSQ